VHHGGMTVVGICEDDPDVRRVLTDALRMNDHQVVIARNGREAVDNLGATSGVEVLILDVGLPDADGRDVCQALRARGATAPVLFLTARDALTDRLAGFNAGGDDYLTKPFHLDELVVRLRALLRRSGADPRTTVGTLHLDPVAHAAASGDHEVSLTPTEFRLLAALVAQPGAAVRRRDLVRAAWPEGAIVHENTLDQYVARLRRKLRELAADTEIVTVHGVGYRIG
jgi:two-component system, OmpR family, response regulator